MEIQRSNWMRLLRQAPLDEPSALLPSRYDLSAGEIPDPSTLGQPPTECDHDLECYTGIDRDDDDELLRSIYAPALKQLTGKERTEPEDIIMDVLVENDGLEDATLKGML